MSNADDFFGGGNPSAKFPSPGTVIEGVITRVGEKMQQRDFTTGKPKFYDGGDPMMQLPIDIQTELRDPAIDGDTGLRTLYVKGQMQKAFRAALRQVGAPGPRVNGRLRITYVRDTPPENGRGLPSKFYEVAYQPPAQQAGDSFFEAQPAAQTTAVNPPPFATAGAAPAAGPQFEAGRPPF